MPGRDDLRLLESLFCHFRRRLHRSQKSTALLGSVLLDSHVQSEIGVRWAEVGQRPDAASQARLRDTAPIGSAHDS